MDLVPVIDVSQGRVVRGLAGERSAYALNTSCLVKSADPLETCVALRQNFSPSWIYVADLDGLQSGAAQLDLFRALANCGAPLAVDAGTTSLEQACQLLELGVQQVIIALETLPEVDLLGQFVRELGAERVMLSLDMMNGQPLGAGREQMHPVQIASEAVRQGVRRMIVLDMAHIGLGGGVATVSLCHTIKNRWPELVVWTGGGVRSLLDLHEISLARVDGVMVASALHDGRLTPADWRSFQRLNDDQILLALDA